MHICTYVHIYTYVYAHIYVRTYIRTDIYVHYMCTQVHKCIPRLKLGWITEVIWVNRITSRL